MNRSDLLLIGWLMLLFAVPALLVFLSLSVVARWRGSVLGYGPLGNLLGPFLLWCVGYALMGSGIRAKSIANLAEFIWYGLAGGAFWLPSLWTRFDTRRSRLPLSFWMGVLLALPAVVAIYFVTPVWPEVSPR